MKVSNFDILGRGRRYEVDGARLSVDHHWKGEGYQRKNKDNSR